MADPFRPGNQYQHIQIDQGGKAQLGDMYILCELSHLIQEVMSADIHTSPWSAAPAPLLPPSYQLGLNLEDALQIDEQLFIRWEDELAHLHKWLSLSTEWQNVVAIFRLREMGKTQLSLHFVWQHHQHYSAVIWLNASSEVTLKAAYISLTQRIQRHNKQREAGQSDVIVQWKEEQAIQLV